MPGCNSCTAPELATEDTLCSSGICSSLFCLYIFSPLGVSGWASGLDSLRVTGASVQTQTSQSLRRELQSKVHGFSSDTDTEVIVHLYEEVGEECVNRLNGMFAFAICDLRSGTPKLFLARDHFGVKPFYYFHRGERFAFASEIKALLEVPGIEAELDPESLHQYLTFLWVPDPRTMFREIHKLPAGHCATFREGH